MPAPCEPPTKQAAVAVRAHAGSAQSSPADSDTWSPLKQIMAAPTRVHLLPLLGMQLKAEKDAKFELVLETWVRLKLLFDSIVRFCARLTRLKLISCWIKKL